MIKKAELASKPLNLEPKQNSDIDPEMLVFAIWKLDIPLLVGVHSKGPGSKGPSSKCLAYHLVLILGLFFYLWDGMKYVWDALTHMTVQPNNRDVMNKLCAHTTYHKGTLIHS